MESVPFAYDRVLTVASTEIRDLYPEADLLPGPTQKRREASDSDAYDPLAETLEPDALKRFLRADAAYFKKKSRHIDINEGTSGEGNARRSVRWQMQLWVSRNVLNIPGAAAANLPGCSDHNYGLAVDLKAVDAEMKAALTAEGWTDKYPAERWHFTCDGSSAFATVQKKISELRAGLAESWRRDFTRSFELNKQAGVRQKQLDAEAEAFRARVDEFNREAKRYNDARAIFQRDTDPYAAQRDHVLGVVAEVERTARAAEDAYVQFIVAADELIEAHARSVEELRALRALPPDRIDVDSIAAARRVSPVLLARYRTTAETWRTAVSEASQRVSQLTKLSEELRAQIDPFGPRALELLRTHERLASSRAALEQDRTLIERAYVDTGLMGREATALMGRAGELLERIQVEVDSVST